MNNRKIALDYLKFFCLIIIIIHHSHILEGYLFHGYILVELFFMISGYLLISQCQKHEKIEVLTIMNKRLKKIYPEYFFAWVLMFSVLLIGHRSFPYPNLYNMIAEIFLVQNWYKVGGINYPAWYISVMVLAEIVILMLYKYIGKKTYIISSSLVVILIYGLLIFFSPTQIEIWEVKAYIFYVPFWRGLADMMLGGLIYYVSLLLNGKINVLFVNIVYFVLIGILCALMCVQKSTDYFCVAIICVVVLLSTFDNNILNKLKIEKVHGFIKKYQYGLFLNHACMILVFGKISNYFPYKMVRLLVLLAFTIVGTVVYKQFQNLVIKHLEKKIR